MISNFDKSLVTKIIKSKQYTSYYSKNLCLNRMGISTKCMGKLSRLKKVWRNTPEKEKDKILDQEIPYIFETLVFIRSEDGNAPNINDGYTSFDVSNCFPNIALKLGLISKEYYNEINELKKKERLLCLGAMSSKKIIYHIKNAKVISVEKKDAIEPKFFFTLINYLNKSNLNVFNHLKAMGCKRMFFYCDAVFLPNEFLDYCIFEDFDILKELNKFLPYREEAKLKVIEKPKFAIKNNFDYNKKLKITMMNIETAEVKNYHL